MKTLKGLGLGILVVLGFGSAIAGEHWTDEQKAVWTVVSDSWADEVAENGKWPGEYVHEDAHDWSDNWPAPRGVDSLESWTRFGDESGTTLQYELFPMNVTVVNDTAVVHYGVVMVSENYKGERDREHIGVVETLTRTGDRWKFVGLTGFDLKRND